MKRALTQPACWLIGLTLLGNAPPLGAQSAPRRLAEAEPVQLGFDPSRLAQIDQVVARSMLDREIPGAAVLVGRHGRIAYVKAWGYRALEPALEVMTRDTLFDLASLTKPIATGSVVAALLEQKKLRLDATLAELLPEFDNHEKGSILLEQLLRHRTGFVPDNPLSDYQDGAERAWQALANLSLTDRPGTRFVYSDVNFEVLGRIAERVGGASLDRLAASLVFEPLGMADTRFHRLDEPLDPARIDRAATTENVDGNWLKGVVHDPRSRLLGGVAGHAGLFSTVDDLAVFAASLLPSTGTPPARFLKPETIELTTTAGAHAVADEERGLAWDLGSPYNAARGQSFGTSSFGHTGFTGTSIWLDPETDTFVIVLASRLHPTGHGPSLNVLRSQVATIVGRAIVDRPAPRVRNGVDVLADRGFAVLKGKRVGLVTNHTGRNQAGVSTIDVLRNAPGVNLVALFSPEHGIRGQLDRKVDDDTDPSTGLVIHSLYGATQKPTAESLANLDVLVFDIQDIGVRFYTYSSTLGLCLEAAAERGIPMVVLDRPNPIGGLHVAGPVRDPGFASFIAYHAMPVVHGMTVGEMARLFNAERKIGANLEVIPCEGWRRADTYDATGLLWINPSPNMRSLTQARVYPGVGLLEATNLATGRGTDTPFERVGAPYIDPVAWSAALRKQAVPGLSVLPARFTPSERLYAGQECGGVILSIDDLATFEPMELAFGLARSLRELYPETWNPAEFHTFLADDAAFAAFEAGKPFHEIEATWRDELNAFRKTRERYLIYP